MPQNPKVVAARVATRVAKRRGSIRIVSLALVGLVAMAYANSLNAGFVLDSRVIILENPLLRAVTWDNVVAICTHDYWYPAAANGLYRPLTSLSYLVNYAVLGNADQPLGYRVINLVLHWACCVFTYALLLRLGAAPLLGAFAAALFAVHPVNTEAVTNLVGRADLLAAFAVMAGLLAYLQARARSGPAQLVWLVLLYLAAAIGIFSKENAIVLFPIIVAYELIVHAPADRKIHALSAGTLGISLIFLAASAIWMWVRAHGDPVQAAPLDNPILAADRIAGRATAVAVIGEQIWQLLWPATLSADYSYNQVPIVTWPPRAGTVMAWITVALVVTAIPWHRARRPVPVFLITFFLLALVPTANLFAVIGTIRADRALYLPLIGFAGATSLAAAQICDRLRMRRALTVVLVLAIAACSWRTALRNRDWRNDDALWSSTIDVAPASAKAHKGYAAALFARGGEENLDGARGHARRAIAIRPDYLEALSDLGAYEITWANGRATAGRQQEARLAYGRATNVLRAARRIDRDRQRAMRQHRRDLAERGSVSVYRNLSLAYLGLGNLDGAVVATRYARRLDPRAPQTYLDLSGLEARRGNWNDAAVSLFALVTLEPGNRAAWTRLIELYQIIQPGTRALVADGANGVTINDDDPLVRGHRCSARAELARLFARARSRSDERAARRWVTEHCPRT